MGLKSDRHFHLRSFKFPYLGKVAALTCRHYFSLNLKLWNSHQSTKPLKKYSTIVQGTIEKVSDFVGLCFNLEWLNILHLISNTNVNIKVLLIHTHTHFPAFNHLKHIRLK